MTLPKYALFDLNHTVHDVSAVPRDVMRDYGSIVADFRDRGVYRPLVLSPEWEVAPPHPDAGEGIARLRSAGIKVVTLSNNPCDAQARMLERSGIEVDGMVPLEWAKVYKPDPAAYAYALGCLSPGTLPSDCLMVTANETFGDLTQARALGMRAELIRRSPATVEPAEGPRTIVELAEMLGR